MKHLMLCLFCLLVVVIFNPVHAQISDSIRKWSIEECFKYAMEHNIEINTLLLMEQSSAQDLYAAKGSQIPNLSGSVNNQFNNSKIESAGSGNLENQLTSSGNYSVNSSIVLWNANYIKNNIKQRDLLRQSAGLSVQQSRNTITFLITQSYLAILLAKENLTYLLDLYTTSEAKVKQGQLFYDAGSIPKNNLLQLQAQLAGDKYLVVQTQNTIRQNILSLKQILQLPTEVLFDVFIPVSIEIVTVAPSLQSVQQTAFEIFPEIKIGELEVAIASLDIAKAKAGFKPTLAANGALGTGYSSVISNSNFSKTSYFTQLDNNFYQRVGLNLSIPIFSNRINKTNLEKANIGFKQANINLQNSQLVLSQEVEQAYLNFTNALQAYNAAKEQLSAVTETYRIVNEQFRLGGINSFDLLQQRNQYVQAVQSYTQTKYTAVLQQKIYDFYRGIPIQL
ncbi:TolC family protein [Flavobacterium sp. 83]|uniref:TolC family protein n=1 Tax=Flavobacterium sp. 83 TaxID=1131812 RepID=UPI0005506E5F|nr:TolC family protein [Flavobacterium sp. 83]